MRILLLIAILFSFCGCSTFNTMKSWVGLGSDDKEAAPSPESLGPPLVKFSDTSNYGVPDDRQYKRMTRQQMEEDSELASNAGSMWVMEGQGAYLFTQNKIRKEGDLLNVKLEGAAKKQVVTKANVIQKLVKQLEELQAQQNRGPAEAKAEDKKEEKAGEATAATPPKTADAPPVAEKPNDDIKEENFEVQEVPTRITEKMPDGSYKIKGDRPFMIGKKEYKVIVGGFIRSEDYSDEGVSSQKILDPQFDVVAIKRSVQ